MKKIRIISVFLAIIISISATTAVSVSAEQYNDYYYAIKSDNTVKISSYTGTETSLIIPREIDGLVVTEISWGAFTHTPMLTSVVIPDSIEYVGEGAFNQGEKLTIYCEGSASDTSRWYRDGDPYTFGTWYLSGIYYEDGKNNNQWYEEFRKHSPTIYHNYADTPVTSMYFGASKIEVTKGKTSTFYAKSVTPQKNNCNIQWSSSNTKIFDTVKYTGSKSVREVRLSGISLGKAYLTATNSEGKELKKILVTVTQPVTSIKTNKTTVKLAKGKETVVKATKIGGSYNDSKIKWYTNSRKKMALVNISKNTHAVRIKGLKKGSCYLVAKNSDNKILKKIKVKVK